MMPAVTGAGRVVFPHLIVFGFAIFAGRMVMAAGGGFSPTISQCIFPVQKVRNHKAIGDENGIQLIENPWLFYCSTSVPHHMSRPSGTRSHHLLRVWTLLACRYRGNLDNCAD